MHTRRCPTSTATIASPGLNPLVMELEATWYIEMLKASAIQKPRSDGHVHFLSSNSKGTGSRSLMEPSPPLALANDPGSRCSLKRSTSFGAMPSLVPPCCDRAFLEENLMIDGNGLTPRALVANVPTILWAWKIQTRSTN